MAQILLIEDDNPLLRLYQSTLEAEYYEVVAVDSVETAMTDLAAQPFDVVVLDLNLPGTPGTDFLKYMSDNTDGLPTPVIVLSEFSHAKTGALPENVVEVLSKPVIPSMLLRVVDAAAASMPQMK